MDQFFPLSGAPSIIKKPTKYYEEYDFLLKTNHDFKCIQSD